MPQVIILPIELTGEVAVGETLLDAGEKAGVEMQAGCCDCSCGACVVELVDGRENLEPPTAAEREVLAAWNRDPEHYRLACSARVREGRLTIRQMD